MADRIAHSDSDFNNLDNISDSKKKNTPSLIILCLIFLLGMAILLYPGISNYIAAINVTRSANEYLSYVADLSEEEIEKMWQEAIDYNNSLVGNPVKDPFVPGSGVALPENYLEVLNTGDSIMGYISVPSANIYLPVRHGTDKYSLDNGAGHIEQTALPIGGVDTHSVVTAHTGSPAAELFNRLRQVKEGDKFVYSILDKTITYQVDRIEIIEPENIDQLKRIEGEDYSTLVTCTPYGINSHRLLVRGTRVENDENDITSTSNNFHIPWNIIIIAAVCFGILIVIFSKGRKDYE